MAKPVRPGGNGANRDLRVDGQEFTALNGGPHFAFTEAISLYVDCESQEEVDELWAKLTAGGEESMCGWLKDKYGLSWQIVPRILLELMQDKDPVKASRVTAAMLQMPRSTSRSCSRRTQVEPCLIRTGLSGESP